MPSPGSTFRRRAAMWLILATGLILGAERQRGLTSMRPDNGSRSGFAQLGGEQPGAAHLYPELVLEQPDPRPRPYHPDAAHHASRPSGCSGPEPDVLDPRPHLRTGRVAPLLPLAQRLVAIPLAGIRALQAIFLQLRLDLRRPIGAVRPHLRGRVVRIENVIHTLADRAPPRPSLGNAAPACASGPTHRGSCSRNGSCRFLVQRASVSFWEHALAGWFSQPVGCLAIP